MNQNKQKVQKEEFELNGWKFEFTKSGIMASQQLDHLKDELKLNNIPDVVFGENICRLSHPGSDFCLEFNPKDSLFLTNFQSRTNAFLDLQNNPELKNYSQANNCTIIPAEVKVKYSQQWKNKKPQDPTTEVRVIQQISDVFFSTPYKGTTKKLSTLLDPQQNDNYYKNIFENQVIYQNVQDLTLPYVERTMEELPLHNLTEQNPIKWSNMIHLWEDELGDSGYTMSEVRFRVMGDCWFALLRHYLRVDEVLIRIYDTRYYHDFNQNYVLREFQVREDSYQNIKARGFQFTPKWNIDQAQSHIVYQYVKTVLIDREKIYFK